jgi:hypothetical protein
MTIVVTRPEGQETTMRGQVEITPKDGDPVRVTVTWDPIIIG